MEMESIYAYKTNLSKSVVNLKSEFHTPFHILVDLRTSNWLLMFNADQEG